MDLNRIVLLDGGTGTTLRERGVEVPCHRTSIWSARAVDLQPGVVQQVHQEYLQAGAQVITACNYAITPALLAREGMEAQFERLTSKAVRVALEACERVGGDVRVAASLPPLETSYRADLVPEDAVLREAYREMARIVEDRVDILICETMSLGRECLQAAEAALETDCEVWISFTLQGNRPGRLPGRAARGSAQGSPVENHVKKPREKTT